MYYVHIYSKGNYNLAGFMLTTSNAKPVCVPDVHIAKMYFKNWLFNQQL